MLVYSLIVMHSYFSTPLRAIYSLSCHFHVYLPLVLDSLFSYPRASGSGRHISRGHLQLGENVLKHSEMRRFYLNLSNNNCQTLVYRCKIFCYCVPYWHDPGLSVSQFGFSALENRGNPICLLQIQEKHVLFLVLSLMRPMTRCWICPIIFFFCWTGPWDSILAS